MSYLLGIKLLRGLRSRGQTQQLTGDLLHRRYAHTVLGYVAVRLGAGPEAEDVTAEVFAALLGRLDACPHPAEDGAEHDPARAWILGVARRKVADALRKKTRRREESLPTTLLVAPGEAPEAQTLAAEAARQLRAILETLPADQREALLLKYVDGLGMAEIGAVMGRSPRAANQLLYRAREAVRQRGGAYFTMEETE